MGRRGSQPSSAVGMICLLLCTPGGLGQMVWNPATRRVVNGTLGQSVTLPGNIPGGISTVWEFTNLTKKVQVCAKYPSNPPQCKRKNMRLNLQDNSLEIQNLTQSDQGLYEISVTMNEDVHEDTMKLRVYERVSTPVVNVIEVSSDVVCNASLHCSLEGGPDVVYSWWTRDGEVTADESHTLSDDVRRLVLSFILHHNNSVYGCKVRNPVSEANGSVDLTEHCSLVEGDGTLKPLHRGLIFAIAVIALIMGIVCCIYWKRGSKHDEVPNTEGRSASVEYAVIGRPNSGRDQPQRHLRQLDDGEGRHGEGAQLTTVYDEIKWHPDVFKPRAAAERGELNTQCSKPGT